MNVEDILEVLEQGNVRIKFLVCLYMCIHKYTKNWMHILPYIHVVPFQVKVLKELCQKLGIQNTARLAKLDLIKKLKEHLQIPSEFVKVFSKFWGGSGEKV